jgi:hypothetical protein
MAKIESLVLQFGAGVWESGSSHLKTQSSTYPGNKRANGPKHRRRRRGRRRRRRKVLFID